MGKGRPHSGIGGLSLAEQKLWAPRKPDFSPWGSIPSWNHKSLACSVTPGLHLTVPAWVPITQIAWSEDCEREDVGDEEQALIRQARQFGC